jgi:hypothetical protein
MKKLLTALDYDCATLRFASNNVAGPVLKTAKNLHGNTIIKGSQNRKWLEKYCHGKCFGRSFTYYSNTSIHLSNQTKKMNIIVVLKQGFSSTC